MFNLASFNLVFSTLFARTIFSSFKLEAVPNAFCFILKLVLAAIDACFGIRVFS
jgi:hypothetical protein